MKTNIITLTALAIALSLPLAARAADEEADTTLAKIPAAAAKALREHAGKAKIDHVSKEKDEGKVVYEGSFKVNGRVTEVSVNEAGKTLSVESQIVIGEVPAAARKTIEEHAAGGKIEKLELVKEGGKTTYEALISAKGKREEIVVSPAGKVLETEDKTKEKKE